MVQDAVTVTPPKPIRESSIWFYNEKQRGLSRRDPHQGELDLAVIPMRPRIGAAIIKASESIGATNREVEPGA